jgi:hypothetical protein
MVLDVALVGIITRGGAYPTPDGSHAHVLDSRVTWYGASELLATARPRA